MVRNLITVVLIGIGFGTAAQEQYIDQGVIKASATLSPSLMLNRNVQNMYISGFLGYQLERHLSLRGDTYFFMKGAASSATDFTYSGASNTYFGAFYHTGIKNWDNYLGFQPGLALIQSVYAPNLSVCPSFALKLGTSYFVWKYFHFFADLTYTNTTIRNVENGSLRADELIISAGLGFQINTRRK